MRAFLRLFAFLTAGALLAYGLVSRRDTIWLATLYAAMIPIGYILFSLVPRRTIGWRRNAWKISAVLVVAFVTLSLQLLRQQFIEASTLAAYTVPAEGGVYANPRLLSDEIRVQRGRIFDASGKVELAGRVIGPDGRVQRTYPEPNLSYVTGYYSLGNYDRVGLEKRYDDYLSGRRGNPIGEARSTLLRQPVVGSDLYLTMDIRLQNLGHELLGDQRGAIIVMNPRTGAVLAMVSNPAYDANQLAVDPQKPFREEQARIKQYWDSIIADPEAARLVNRAIRARFPPGSTFKTVTTSAALDTRAATPDKVYEDDGQIVVNGFVINDPNRPDESRTRWTLAEGYQWSLNAVLAQVGLDVGSAGMSEYGRRFGFEREIPFDLSITPSQLAGDPAFLSDRVALASTAFGQGQLLATPMQVLLTTAAIANNGVIPTPYLVREIRSPQGTTVLEQGYKPFDQVVSPATAQQMRDIMVTAVERGTGTEARVAGVEVGGKTGTAQLGARQAPHAWFTGFAPAEDPEVAVVVFVENGGEGAEVAAPIAGRLLEEALRNR